jgi:small subunit ribosomal protein S21
MLIVSVKNGKIEWALKDYKKRIQSTKQIEELRERKNFTKPSVRKRLQKEETIRKNKLFL